MHQLEVEFAPMFSALHNKVNRSLLVFLHHYVFCSLNKSRTEAIKLLVTTGELMNLHDTTVQQCKMMIHCLLFSRALQISDNLHVITVK